MAKPKFDPNDLIGKETEVALMLLEMLGVRHRFSRIDTQRYILTMDYVPNRVNLTVDNGIVTGAHVG